MSVAALRLASISDGSEWVASQPGIWCDVLKQMGYPVLPIPSPLISSRAVMYVTILL